ncbi:MAG: hypothetical protein R3F14_08450 [Polyangiaceae bacterium]
MHREPPGRRVLRIVAFVASAAGAALILRFTWERPLVSGAVLLGLAVVVLVRWLARRRVRRALVSGDVEAVLREWSSSIARAPHAGTMAPLMTATAFAANGWIDHARAALAAAQRGPAWDAALEHRLFLEALLLTFEGDRDEALRQADRLARLPVPDASAPMRDRIQMLRLAIGAFARAFAHRTERGDGELLERAANVSPLVHWAMRYACAVVAIDEGNKARARAMLDGAPDWPVESAFRGFHDEIAAHSR